MNKFYRGIIFSLVILATASASMFFFNKKQADEKYRRKNPADPDGINYQGYETKNRAQQIIILNAEAVSNGTTRTVVISNTGAAGQQYMLSLSKEYTGAEWSNLFVTNRRFLLTVPDTTGWYVIYAKIKFFNDIVIVEEATNVVYYRNTNTSEDATPAVVFPPGLVTYFKFENSLVSAANGYSMVVETGSAAYSAGTNGNCLNGSAIDERIVLTNHPVIGITKFSLLLWFKYAAYGLVLMFKEAGVNNDEIIIGQYSNNKLFAYLQNSGLDDIGPLPANTWIHLALTWDGSTLRLFRNGIESTNVSRTLTLSLDGRVILGNQGTINATVNGQNQIDELYFFTNCLSASQITGIMTNRAY
ncbi:MAG: hypothetical protein A2096_14880 [Spirochaetes bacterium GWF1_41_5]|nr:MAG: hypothetical protein A2096_14880 [Spirochaetes bacterium GWF1_41_5]HBE02828.1 hypothetical protein [Spirochaetia bacterium]